MKTGIYCYLTADILTIYFTEMFLEWSSTKHLFLAHPSQRLIWWAYRIGRPLSSSLFKHLLLRNHWANQSQISYGASMGWERKFAQMALVTWPRWPPRTYMVKTLKNLLLNQKADDLETWYASAGARVLPSLLKWWSWVDLDLVYSKVKFGPLWFCMGKR